MHIAVLGAGAMGSWFGGLLAMHGHRVQLLTTNKAHREAIAANDLILRKPNSEKRVSLQALSPTEMQPGVELILVFTKSFQTRDAMAGIADRIESNTQVLSLQNGLGNAENIATQIPLNRIWIGVSMMPVDKIAPGIVACKGQGNSFFGSATNKNNSLMAGKIADTFQQSGISLRHETNIDKRIWEKVGFNAGMNAICALSHGRPGCVEDSPGAKQLAKDVADEVLQVALAQQIEFDIDCVYDLIELSCTQHGDHIPSMLQDLYARRLTEVDALNGAVARIAEEAGIQAPLNHALTTLVKLAELSHQRYT